METELKVAPGPTTLTSSASAAVIDSGSDNDTKVDINDDDDSSDDVDDENESPSLGLLPSSSRKRSRRAPSKLLSVNSQQARWQHDVDTPGSVKAPALVLRPT